MANSASPWLTSINNPDMKPVTLPDTPPIMGLHFTTPVEVNPARKKRSRQIGNDEAVRD